MTRNHPDAQLIGSALRLAVSRPSANIGQVRDDNSIAPGGNLFGYHPDELYWSQQP
jgi:hypothetical protein